MLWLFELGSSYVLWGAKLLAVPPTPFEGIDSLGPQDALALSALGVSRSSGREKKRARKKAAIISQIGA